MAGSQLKQLKAALKEKGLVGQTNIKRKNKKTAPSDTRRDNELKHREITKIRDEFNQFDNRINRSKHDFTVILGGKFVKAGSKQHNETSKSHSGVEKAMQLDYKAQKLIKGRSGGLVDRRFGEKNRNMTEEEKMLARFTRERQSGTKKNAFSLGSDDEYDEDEGFSLTHSGKKLDFANFEESDLGVGSNPTYVDEDSIEPPRKKSKKDVMAEIIAKSKFHKKQRQMEFQKTQEEIMDLDDDFADVMNDLHSQKSNGTNGIVPKSKEDMEYDAKVRELTYDRRSVPADRTKTAEEIALEHNEKMKKLEADRLMRMQGLQTGDADADDLDDNFWGGSDDEEGFAVEEEGEEEENSEGSEDDEEDQGGRPKRTITPAVSMPSSHEQFVEQLSTLESSKIVPHIKKISEVYHPRLAQGNKEKMDNFVGIIFEHILYLANQEDCDSQLIDGLTKLVRSMAEQYNQALVETVREEIARVQERIVDKKTEKKDLVFFVTLGYIFSASDHFHLVITPTLILMNQFLNNCISELDNISLQTIGQGLFVCDALLNYQFFAKRYDPEVVKFVERCILLLVPEPAKIGSTLSSKKYSGSVHSLLKTFKPASGVSKEPLKLQMFFENLKRSSENEFRFRLLSKALAIMDRCCTIWREKSGLIEILHSFEAILKHLAKFYAAELPVADMLGRFSKLDTNMSKSRKPLRLQEHRQLAIRTFAPKFEENFNPDKKSYDINRERQEVNKMKAQIKKEKKLAMKDLRKQTRFVARQQIGEKKQMYADYHRKMANIVNSISTVEGAEKNEYEREKKRRQQKK